MPYTVKGPGYKRGDTAYEAAEAIAPRVKPLHGQILAALGEKGPMTADEVADLLGFSVLSIRPRFTELLFSSRIRDTGDRRANASGRRAAVWEVVPQ